MSTMDINEFVQQQTDMSSYDRQELLYYIDNAINNFVSAQTKTPQSAPVMSVFGSTNSNDVDIIFELKDEKDEEFTRKIEEFFEMSIATVMESKSKGEARKLDITFIMTKHGQVSWSNKGNIEELNNAIMATYKDHVSNYDIAEKDYRECPVTSMVNMDVGQKALSTIRQLLTIISRTDYGREAKKLLLNRSYYKRLQSISEMLDDGIFGSITDTLNKNQSDESLLKDVAFGFIQLDAILNDKMIPYSKNAVFNTDHRNLLPFIFEMANFSNDYADYTQFLDEIIEDTVASLMDSVQTDEDGVLYITGDEHSYDVRKEKPIYV